MSWEAKARQLDYIRDRCRDCRGTGYVQYDAPAEPAGFKRDDCDCGPSRQRWYLRDGSLGQWSDAEMEAKMAAIS